MICKFPSIANPESVGYRYDSDAYDSNALVCYHMQRFDTYGDGMTQHSYERSIQPADLADWLFSAAAYMLQDDRRQDDRTLADRLWGSLLGGPSPETIAFAASCIYTKKDEAAAWDKQRFVSLSLKKIGTKPALEYDKRYVQIERWMDGTPEAIYRMLRPEYADGLTCLIYAVNIREWALKNLKTDCPLAAHMIGWWRDDWHDKPQELRHALDVARAVVKANEDRRQAQSGIDTWQRKHERARKQAEEVAAAAAVETATAA